MSINAQYWTEYKPPLINRAYTGFKALDKVTSGFIKYKSLELLLI